MRVISQHLQLYTLPDEDIARILYSSLRTLFMTNMAHLHDAARRGKPLPRLYDSGVVYRREEPGVEDWRCIPEVLKVRIGDCEDLACWRAAELKFSGEDLSARPRLLLSKKPNGISTYHVIVGRSRNKLEDPSAKLGMLDI